MLLSMASRVFVHKTTTNKNHGSHHKDCRTKCNEWNLYAVLNFHSKLTANKLC